MWARQKVSASWQTLEAAQKMGKEFRKETGVTIVMSRN